MGRSARIGWSGVSVVLVAFGLLSNHWWTLDIGGLGELGGVASGRVGLRGSEACIAGICQATPISARGGLFGLLVQVTYVGGLLAVAMLIAGTALRELRGEPRAARLAGASCVALMLCSILTVIVGMAKSNALGSLTPSYAGAMVVVGCLIGAYASRLDASAWDGSEAPVVAVKLPVRQPTAPTSTARQLSHDLDAQIRDATRSVAPPSVKAARKQGASAVADASIDAVRSTLRFVAISIEIGESGLTAVLDGNKRHELAFTEITQVIARRLPADPPFESMVLVDLIVAGRPIRILPSTAGNYNALPGPSSVRAIENVRKLGAALAAKHPGVLEPPSEAFFLHGKQPPAFAAIKQFVAYDAKYG